MDTLTTSLRRRLSRVKQHLCSNLSDHHPTNTPCHSHNPEPKPKPKPKSKSKSRRQLRKEQRYWKKHGLSPPPRTSSSPDPLSSSTSTSPSVPQQNPATTAATSTTTTTKPPGRAEEPINYEVTDEQQLEARICRTMHSTRPGDPLCERCARTRKNCEEIRRKSEEVGRKLAKQEREGRRRRSADGRYMAGLSRTDRGDDEGISTAGYGKGQHQLVLKMRGGNDGVRYKREGEENREAGERKSSGYAGVGKKVTSRSPIFTVSIQGNGGRRKSEELLRAGGGKEKEAAKPQRSSWGGGRSPIMEVMLEVLDEEAAVGGEKRAGWGKGKMSEKRFGKMPATEGLGEEEQGKVSGPFRREKGVENDAAGQHIDDADLDILYADLILQCEHLVRTNQSLLKSHVSIQRKFARLRSYTDGCIKEYMVKKDPQAFSSSSATGSSSFGTSGSQSQSVSTTSLETSSSQPASLSSTAPSSSSGTGNQQQHIPQPAAGGGGGEGMAQAMSLLTNRMFEVSELLGDELSVREKETEGMADNVRVIEDLAARMERTCRYVESYLERPGPTEGDMDGLAERMRRRRREGGRYSLDGGIALKRKGKELLPYGLRKSLEMAENEFTVW